MHVTRMESKQLKQAVELSDRIFLKQPEQPSMGTSFPFIFDPGVSHSYGAFDEEGKIASFMGLVPFTIRINAAELRVYSIGSVCTDPESRGKGLAGELLNQCFKHAERAGASLVFISGGRSLYTRAGCRLFGRASEHRMTPETADRLSGSLDNGWEVREMEAEDLFRVHELLGNRTAAYAASPNELDKLLGASAFANVIRLEQKVLTAAKDGEIKAVAVLGVPGTRMTPSRPATLIEWAGNGQAAAFLLSQALTLYGLQELIVPLAWQDRELSGLLEASGAAKENIRNTGTVYLVNGRELLRQIAPLFPEETAGMLQAEGEHGPYRYSSGGKTIMLDDEGLLSLLFDPQSPYREQEQENGRHALPVIPLPYTSGLQYI
ncbi:GNAT family N-acetyltransferase [Paenibacillus sp. DMB20]|uniref:GNAT family N-acetyltransferase n=1 Tax=Paenibacillus sp. DMB20 TaxID=1642570 RepID=UPI000627C047|nr:GNAT family N-acetyltransferase [Paenibacillus sp. DMB20]KKO54250.1 GCN5 family acetyltransferase [Paenibacillus sp. DMB20]